MTLIYEEDMRAFRLVKDTVEKIIESGTPAEKIEGFLMADSIAYRISNIMCHIECRGESVKTIVMGLFEAAEFIDYMTEENGVEYVRDLTEGREYPIRDCRGYYDLDDAPIHFANMWGAKVIMDPAVGGIIATHKDISTMEDE